MTSTTQNRQAAFTLVEILVVTAIIGILMGIVFSVSGLAGKKSDSSKALSQMQKIRNALEEYRLQYGSYPVFNGKMTDAGFAATKTKLTETMNNKVPDLQITDPWGRGYVYSNQSIYAYSLYTLGAKINDSSDDLDSANSNY